MSPQPAEARHYAVRRVNPYEGVLQVVETADARAYSPNGRVWQVQVMAERPDHTWRSFSHVTPVRQFFNFGLWDATDGMQRVPANPVMDIGAMTAAAEHLGEVLRAVSAHLPFTLIDHFECWSTDHHDRPVALLASTENPEHVSEIRTGRWQATRLGEHGFVSAHLLSRGIAAHGDLGPRQHAEHLERQVRQLGQRKAWFRRTANGDGERLGHAGAESMLPRAQFPVLGLRTDWGDDRASRLVQDYLDWSAPRLLLLQHIDGEQREYLEQLACHQALALAEVFPLLPQIVDRERVEAARVEARLRRATT